MSTHGGGNGGGDSDNGTGKDTNNKNPAAVADEHDVLDHDLLPLAEGDEPQKSYRSNSKPQQEKGNVMNKCVQQTKHSISIPNAPARPPQAPHSLPTVTVVGSVNKAAVSSATSSTSNTSIATKNTLLKNKKQPNRRLLPKNAGTPPTSTASVAAPRGRLLHHPPPPPPPPIGSTTSANHHHHHHHPLNPVNAAVTTATSAPTPPRHHHHHVQHQHQQSHYHPSMVTPQLHLAAAQQAQQRSFLINNYPLYQAAALANTRTRPNKMSPFPNTTTTTTAAAANAANGATSTGGANVNNNHNCSNRQQNHHQHHLFGTGHYNTKNILDFHDLQQQQKHKNKSITNDQNHGDYIKYRTQNNINRTKQNNGNEDDGEDDEDDYDGNDFMLAPIIPIDDYDDGDNQINIKRKSSLVSKQKERLEKKQTDSMAPSTKQQACLPFSQSYRDTKSSGSGTNASGSGSGANSIGEAPQSDKICLNKLNKLSDSEKKQIYQKIVGTSLRSQQQQHQQKQQIQVYSTSNSSANTTAHQPRHQYTSSPSFNTYAFPSQPYGINSTSKTPIAASTVLSNEYKYFIHQKHLNYPSTDQRHHGNRPTNTKTLNHPSLQHQSTNAVILSRPPSSSNYTLASQPKLQQKQQQPHLKQQSNQPKSVIQLYSDDDNDSKDSDRLKNVAKTSMNQTIRSSDAPNGEKIAVGTDIEPKSIKLNKKSDAENDIPQDKGSSDNTKTTIPTSIVEKSISSLKTWPTEAQWTYFALLFHLIQKKPMTKKSSYAGRGRPRKKLSIQDQNGSLVFKTSQQMVAYFLHKLILDSFYDNGNSLTQHQSSRLILVCMVEVSITKKDKKHILGLGIVGSSAQSVRHCISVVINFDRIARCDPNTYGKVRSTMKNERIVCDEHFKPIIDKIDDAILKQHLMMSALEFPDVESWADTLSEMHGLGMKAKISKPNIMKKRSLDDWKHVLVRLPMPSNEDKNDTTQHFGFLPLQMFQNGNKLHSGQQPASIDSEVFQRKAEILKMGEKHLKVGQGIALSKVLNADDGSGASKRDLSQEQSSKKKSLENPVQPKKKHTKEIIPVTKSLTSPEGPLRNHNEPNAQHMLQTVDSSQNLKGPSKQEVVGHTNTALTSEKECHSHIVATQTQSFAKSSFSFLRQYIEWASIGNEKENKEKYPHAPLGEVWVDGNLEKFIGVLKGQTKVEMDHINEIEKIILSKASSELNEGKSLIGRKWVWDEGQYTDGICFTNVELTTLVKKKDLDVKPRFIPIWKRAYCDCGRAHAKNVDNGSIRGSLDGPRRSERYGSSVRLSNVLNELADGGLDPHTLISCDEYTSGPSFRLLQMSKEFSKKSNTDANNNSIHSLYNEVMSLASKEKVDPAQVQPFAVKVCPDASFVADLHAHLSESEVIGLLGGRYVPSERCLYVQAAFPCKSTSRGDAGLTDVEMDPVSQIAAGNAISSNGMEVVGWYHSHPRFQPDPSITDIENQSNYQELFRADSLKPENDGLCPFVGLIIGTYDGRNPSARSVMRWFHVTKKQSSVDFPMKLEVTHRKKRDFQYDRTRSDLTSDSKVKMQERLTSIGTSMRFIDELTSLRKSLQFSMMNLGSKNDISNASFCQEVVETLPTQYNDNNPSVGIDNSIHAVQHPENFVHAKDVFSREVKSEENVNCDRKNIMQAHSLPFTREELKILTLGPSDGVTDEIRAGIIWHAIKREQLRTKKMRRGPPNASSILQLLLQAPSICNIEEVRNSKNCMELFDDDAIIVHVLDVVLSHYSKDLRKINPFESWSGAWNLSIGVGKSSNQDTTWWRSYYQSEVLGSTRNNVKMNKGQKITTCLLYWAKHMQLNERKRWSKPIEVNGVGMGNPVELPNDVEFVAEIMRLLVARWYEASTKSNGDIGLKVRGAKRKANVKSKEKRQKKSKT